MKRMVFSLWCLVMLGGNSNLQAQTADGGIFASGTTLSVKFKPSATIVGAFTGGNFAIRWLTSLGEGVTLINETGSFGYVSQPPGKTTDGLYSFIVYASASNVNIATYIAGVEYTLMTVTVSGASGPGEFELTPEEFSFNAGQWYIELGGADRANLISANWYYQASTGEVPLPVELVSLTAVSKGRNVELAWKTATETNNAGFEIQRKQEKSDWSKVGYVEGNGTTAATNNYSFKNTVNTAEKFQYRLKQIDRDGKFSYSGTIEAITNLTSEDYALTRNYPNPFNPTTKFSFAVKNNEPVTVKVFNVLGQDVATLFNGVASANTMYDLNFNASGLASGAYFYMLRTNDRYEIKKMVLMK